MKQIKLFLFRCCANGKRAKSDAVVQRVIKRVVVIGNGCAGAENQCIGLARALGLSHSLLICRVVRPKGRINECLRWLPVSLHKRLDGIITDFYQNLSLETEEKNPLPFSFSNSDIVGEASVLEASAKRIAAVARETFESEGPLLVIASGRDTISTASLVKSLAPDNVFLVQVQHPRWRLSRFDLVVTPQHDYYPSHHRQNNILQSIRWWITPRKLPDSNVVLTVGALHQADSINLGIAADSWYDELAYVPKPLLVVNVGGPTRHCQYGVDLVNQLVRSLKNVLEICGSIRISFSRRTPREMSDVLLKELGNHPKVYIWDGKGKNPHFGHLAWGDAFVITADSISMLSEVCSTGKPVYVIGVEYCTSKFLAFHKTLKERCMTRVFTGNENITQSWTYSPLNDTAKAASRIKEILEQKGWML